RMTDEDLAERLNALADLCYAGLDASDKAERYFFEVVLKMKTLREGLDQQSDLIAATRERCERAFSKLGKLDG
ncbi:hypothetical protein, partial [Pseudomonas aeruginosa]|uniref:hypothetical protein n=1 Tax=Pseudomonas aeruginosa TaxID=287 RepID=UPI0034596E8B